MIVSFSRERALLIYSQVFAPEAPQILAGGKTNDARSQEL